MQTQMWLALPECHAVYKKLPPCHLYPPLNQHTDAFTIPVTIYMPSSMHFAHHASGAGAVHVLPPH